MRPTTSSQITEIAHRWSAHQGQHVAGVRSSTRTPGFIKGPLPLNWMRQAAALPGKALHVGLCVWYLAGLTQSKRVRLTSKTTEAMGVSRDTLRRKIATIRNYSADDLVRWIENRISFEHMETANTLAELAKKTPKQLLNEAMNLGDENGQPMTVDRLTAFALGEQKREPALFRVNTILSRLGRFPLLLKWSSEKTDKFNSLMEAVREFFI